MKASKFTEYIELPMCRPKAALKRQNSVRSASTASSRSSVASKITVNEPASPSEIISLPLRIKTQLQRQLQRKTTSKHTPGARRAALSSAFRELFLAAPGVFFAGPVPSPTMTSAAGKANFANKYPIHHSLRKGPGQRQRPVSAFF